MKVVVVYAWPRDPEAASVRSDGAIDWHNAKMAPGEDDAAALDVAKVVADGLGAELVGLTVADSDASGRSRAACPRPRRSAGSPTTSTTPRPRRCSRQPSAASATSAWS